MVEFLQWEILTFANPGQQRLRIRVNNTPGAFTAETAFETEQIGGLDTKNQIRAGWATVGTAPQLNQGAQLVLSGVQVGERWHLRPGETLAINTFASGSDLFWTLQWRELD